MQVVMIEGDGIGPEVTSAARRVVAAAGVKIDWVKAPAGLRAAEQLGEPLPDETLEMIRRYRVALKGPCITIRKFKRDALRIEQAHRAAQHAAPAVASRSASHHLAAQRHAQ